MKIAIFLGSPRKNGNSESLAASLAKLLQQNGNNIETITLNALTIRACQGCGGCETTGTCIINDDMTPLYKTIDNADIIILVSPVYFYSFSAQMKLFIDRCQARWSRKHLQGIRFRQGENRRGYLLATAATHGKKIFRGMQLTATYLFDALDIDFDGSVLIRGADDKKTIAEQDETNELIQALAKKILLK